MTTPILITTPNGLTSFLREEVQKLKYPIKKVGAAGVLTEGDYTDAMRLNLHLFTAHHVLYLINEFSCDNPQELYRKINAMPWETMISADGYLSVVSNVVHPSIRDTRFANVKTKDAIVDRILIRRGRRPDSGPLRNGAVIHVYWRDEKCQVYIDTSGEPLSKRGYRTNPLHAPMQETLAAAVVKAARLKRSENFINPMCGSGTLAIEAALQSINRAPGSIRKNFGFMHTLFYRKEVWDQLVKDSLSREKAETGRIIATDINADAIKAAYSHARLAGVGKHIDFKAVDFESTEVPDAPGVVVFNPEYGIRMGDEAELVQTYRRIGSFLKKRCLGYRGYVFTANKKLAGEIGLKSGRKISFKSGKLDCRLYEYELYGGTRERE
jgi:putative N6-adenine-specific DNA methylase